MHININKTLTLSARGLSVLIWLGEWREVTTNRSNGKDQILGHQMERRFLGGGDSKAE